MTYNISNWINEQGESTGGSVDGPGVTIDWRAASVAGVLAAIVMRLDHLQTGAAACREREMAAAHMRHAVSWLGQIWAEGSPPVPSELAGAPEPGEGDTAAVDVPGLLADGSEAWVTVATYETPEAAAVAAPDGARVRETARKR